MGALANSKSPGTNVSPSRRLTVFSIREAKGASHWVRAGTAFLNKDGSLNVYLDVLPLDGKLHIREAAERRDAELPQRLGGDAALEPLELAAVGGHS